MEAKKISCKLLYILHDTKQSSNEIFESKLYAIRILVIKRDFRRFFIL